MANPVLITIPVGQWVRVATSVRDGFVRPMLPGILGQTYRETGDPAPVNGNYAEFKEIPWEGEPIVSVNPIDVYVACSGATPSQVRVDL